MYFIASSCSEWSPVRQTRSEEIDSWRQFLPAHQHGSSRGPVRNARRPGVLASSNTEKPSGTRVPPGPLVHETLVVAVAVGARTRRHLGRRLGPAVSLRETALVSAMTFVAAAGVWGPHVFRGGFYWADDWYHARLYVFSDGHGLLANQNGFTSQFSPVLGVLLAVPYRLFGLHTSLHLTLALVLAGATST